MAFFFHFEDELGIDGEVMNQFNVIVGDGGYEVPLLANLAEEWPALTKEVVSKTKQRKQRKAKVERPLQPKLVERLEKKKDLFLKRQQRIAQRVAKSKQREVGPALHYELETTFVPNRFRLVARSFDYSKGEFKLVKEFSLCGSRKAIVDQVLACVAQHSCTFFFKLFSRMSSRALRYYFIERGEFVRRKIHCDFSSLRFFFFSNGFQDQWNDLQFKVRQNLLSICREVEDRLCIYVGRFSILQFSLKSQTESYYQSLRFYLRSKICQEIQKIAQLEEKKKIYSSFRNSYVKSQRQKKFLKSLEKQEKQRQIAEFNRQQRILHESHLIKYQINCGFKDWDWSGICQNIKWVDDGKYHAHLLKLCRAKRKELKESRLRVNVVLCLREKKKNFSLLKKFVEKGTKIQVLPPVQGAVDHQMDSGESALDVDPVQEISQSQASNVLLQDSGVVVPVSTGVQPSYCTRLSEGQQPAIAKEMIERFVPLANISWKSSHQYGTVLKTFNLPNDFIKPPFSDHPNFAVLKKWMYWSFDIELRVQLNATRMQVGQMLISWSYNFDAKRITCISEQIMAPHTLLVAPGNNVVELVIPYKWIFPYWNIPAKSRASFVAVNFSVLSQLKASEGTSSAANILVQARLINMQLAGMRDLTGLLVAEHEMFAMAVKAVEAALRSVRKDLNRDNPSSPYPAPTVVPNTSHSWCIGTNQVEIVNQLRLDPLAVTPHTELSDEMGALFIARHWGLLGEFDWNTNYVYGSFVHEINVTPLEWATAPDYYQASFSLKEKGVSPLGRMTSLYAYWRGSIEYRFDVVASMFHTGRLAVAFVPGSLDSRSFKYDTQSYVQYFDLQDNLSFTFTVPYICDRSWSPTYNCNHPMETFNKDSSIGRIAIYVANPLVSVTGVSSKVNIVCYHRAGEDFKLVVPIFPLLFSSINGSMYIPSDGALWPKKGYYPVYAGVWRYWGAGKKAILRYGTASDQIAQFEGGVRSWNLIYTCASPVEVKTEKDKSTECIYFVRPKITGQDQYFYLVPFSDEATARSFAANPSRSDLSLNCYEGGGWAWADRPSIVPLPTADHQVDDRVVALNAPTFGVTDCVSPLEFYNEQFMDLKTLLRRFSLYCDVSVDVPVNTGYGEVFYIIPIIPSGLAIDFSKVERGNKSLEFQNRARGGPIANVADGFRFFKGGMRFKIVFRCLRDSENVVISVSHVPDRYISSIPKQVHAVTTLDYVANGYAFYSQSSKLNECIEIECPYYLNSDFGLLCNPQSVDPTYSLNCTLGYLAISTLSRLSKATTIGMQVYAAFADDMRFSSYQGFTRSCTAFDIPQHGPSLSRVPIELSQGRERSSSGSSFEDVDHQMDRIKQTVTDSVNFVTDAAIGRTRPAFTELRDNVRAEVQSASEQLGQGMLTKINEILETIRRTAGEWFNIGKNFIITIVSQISHFLLNPTMITFAVCVASVMASTIPIDSNATDWYSFFISFFSSNVFQVVSQSVFGYLFTMQVIKKTDFFKSDINNLVANHQFDNDDLMSFSATFLTLIATALGYKMTPSMHKNAPNFMAYLVCHLKDFTFTANSMIIFLKSNMKLMLGGINWIVNKATGLGLDGLLSTDSDKLKTWCRSAQNLINPLSKSKVMTDPYLQRRVFRMAAQAQEFMVLDAANSSPSKFNILIKDLCSKLIKLQEELINECLCPMARYSPFVLQINGPPNIGKSELFQDLGIDMLKAINYTSYGDPYYVKTSGPSYWNGVNTQPVLIYDDFMMMRSGPLAEEQISEFVQLKSPSVFNPSIAQLEKKNLRYNPLVILLASNAAFWNEDNNIREIKALHRRRDMLFEAFLKPGCSMEEVAARFRQTGIKTYDHLQFQRYLDPSDPSTMKTSPMSFDEFKSMLMSQWKNYHVLELKRYRARLNALEKIRPPSVPIELDEDADQAMMDYLEASIPVINRQFVDTWRDVVKEENDSTFQTVRGAHPGLLHARQRLIDPQMESFEDAHDYACIHERFLSNEYSFVNQQSSGGDQYLWNPNPVRRGGRRQPDTLQVYCEGDCWLRTEASRSRRRLWYDHHFSHEAELVDIVDANRVPEWAWEFIRGRNETDMSGLIDEEIPRAQSRFSRIWENVKGSKWISYLKILLKMMGLMVASVGVMFTGAFAANAAFKAYTDTNSSSESDQPITPDPWHEYAPSGSIRTARVKGAARKLRLETDLLKAKFTKHQCDDTNPIKVLETLIMRNAHEVGLKINGEIRFRQRGLGLCGRIALTTKHFLEEFEYQYKLDSSTVLVVMVNGNEINCNFNECKFNYFHESSLALISFPSRINSFRDIRRHIINEAEVEFLSRSAKFYELDKGRHCFAAVSFDVYDGLSIRGDGDHISQQVLPTVYGYNISGKGKCGSVLYSNCSSPKIIGIHVAGQEGGLGFSQAILREYFEDLTESSVSEFIMADHHGEEFEPKIDPPKGVEFIGCVPPHLAASIPNKSQIVPTLMFDKIYEHQTEPGVLSVKDERVKIDPHIDPVVKAIASHGNIPLPFDVEILEECVEDFSEFIIATTKPQYFLSELLSNQVVFGGIADGGSIKKLNLAASEGYPLSLIRTRNLPAYTRYRDIKLEKRLPLTGKNWLFEFDVTTEGLTLNEIHPELKELIDYNDDLRKQGYIPTSIFVDVLKDARVPFDKIEKGKTRMFSMSPLEFTLACKKYFGHFQSSYQSCRLYNGTAIGINVNSQEWSLLARMLLKKGNNFIVGDYKSFGDTLDREVMRGAFKVIENWYAYYYGYEHVAYRRILMEELFNAPHLVYNVLYRMHCGIPSGFALTVEVNDLVNQLYMRYCWKKITGLSLASFYHNCKLVTYGDDLVMSVSDAVKDIFNFKAIKAVLAAQNIGFQPANKSEQDYDTIDLSEVTFLKCYFIPHPKRVTQFLAKLPLSSCLDMLNWQYEHNDKISILYENARASLMNLFGHGPKVYHHWRAAIQGWFSKASSDGLLPPDGGFGHFKSWKDIDTEIFGDSS